MFGEEEKHGFNFVITTKELRERLVKRADFHKERAAFYGKKAGEFEEDIEQIPQSYENTTMGRHEDQLQRSRQYHIKQARVIQFYADHLPDKQSVELTHKDMVDLELLEFVE